MRAAAVLAGVLATARALTFGGHDALRPVANRRARRARRRQPVNSYTVYGDHVIDNSHNGSKPGSPRVPEWQDNFSPPILDNSASQAWRIDLGRRILNASRAHEALQRCGSFLSWGGFTWCQAAMPKEANPDFKKQYGGVHEYTLGTGAGAKAARRSGADGLSGLSFGGIRRIDPWSELLSSLYFLKTSLYDCSPDKLGPMALDFRSNRSRDDPCRTWHCYTEEYHTEEVCLDDTSGIQGLYTSTDRKKYQSLFAFLRGRRPLSTFVKVDVGGLEWGTLERLLASDEEFAKIRAIDLTVNFGVEPWSAGAAPSREALAHRVGVLERLAEKFMVTGSTIEHVLLNMVGDFRRRRLDDPQYTAPVGLVVTESGLSLNRFSISLVNRQLL